jgi:hypothetical protein
MTVSATENTNKGIKGQVWERKGTFVWQTGDGHAAQTLTLSGIVGALENVIAVISEVTGNPTVNITISDENSATLASFSALADGTVHVKQYPTDFDSILVAGGDITISVDPSADAGGAGQTLTVAVVLRGV